MAKFRIGCSGYDFKWFDVEADSFLSAAEKFCEYNYWVHDADVCGNRTFSVAITDKLTKETKFYNVFTSWWIDNEPEWEIHNEFEINEVPAADELKRSVVTDRDWLIVSRPYRDGDGNFTYFLDRGR